MDSIFFVLDNVFKKVDILKIIYNLSKFNFNDSKSITYCKIIIIVVYWI